MCATYPNSQATFHNAVFRREHAHNRDTKYSFFAFSLTQTVCGGIHNPKFKLWKVSSEGKPGPRCVFHAERSVSSHTLGTSVKLPG